MPAPSVYGLGSGQDHNQTIQKLLELERIPIRRMERQNKRLEFTIKAWTEARNRARKLSDKSRMLYSFLGPFANKSIVSSDPGAITGRATSSVESGLHHMEVLELAARHQLHTKRLEAEQALPAGSFTIEQGQTKKTIRFEGGKPADLERALREGGAEIFDVTRVMTDSSGTLLGLRSKKIGKAGRLSFGDPDGLLQGIGLVKPGGGERETKAVLLKADELRVAPAAGVKNDAGAKKGAGTKSGAGAKAEGTTAKTAQARTGGGGEGEKAAPGSHELLADGAGIRLSGARRVRVARDLSPQSVLILESELTGSSRDEGVKRVVESVTPGPGIEVEVGDVKLRGYEVERSRTTEKPHSAKGKPKAGLALVWKEGAVEKRHSLIIDKHKQSHKFEIAAITGGRPVVALEFSAEADSVAIFRALQVEAPKSQGGLEAAHEVSPARDARLKIEGVEVTRPANDDITDIIKGASLNLRKTTRGPVEVRVFADSDEVVKRIKEWVEAYNELVKFCRDNSKSAAPKELSSSRAADQDLERSMDAVRDSSGIFASDATIRGLVSSMQLITSTAYPAPEKPGFRVLADIGISTGEVGIGNFRNNRYGLLELDEKKLRAALDTSAEGVRQLFASDTNADARIDNGAAHRMHETLKPYSAISGGMIGVRIQLLNDRIADNKKRIASKELSLKSVEERLRRKFGGMETYMRRSRATGDFLRNRLRTGGSE